MSYYITQKMACGRVILDKNEDFAVNGRLMSAIGSVFEVLDERYAAWGTGIIADDRGDNLKNNMEKTKAKNIKVAAVRGPNTRNFLKGVGFKYETLPTIFGDAGLLLPHFYWPEL